LKSVLKKLINLIEKNNLKKFIFLQFLIIFLAVLEGLTIIILTSYLDILTSGYESNNILTIGLSIHAINIEEYFLELGIIIILFLIISSIYSIYVTWYTAIFSQELGASVSINLFNNYLNKSILFHQENNSSNLVKRITFEAQRITSSFIVPLLQLNSKIFTVLVIITLLVIANPIIAFWGSLMFISSYFILFKIVRNRIYKNGQIISSSLTERYSILNSAFGGIKENKISNLENIYLTKFKAVSLLFSRMSGKNLGLGQSPRYIIELIAFSSIILFCLYVSSSSLLDQDIISILALFGLAGFKLIPSLQQIYAAVAQIKSALPAIEEIESDIFEENSSNTVNQFIPSSNLSEIHLQNVSFKYPSKENYSIDNISLNIRSGEVIGIVGQSGSGKSTLLDIICGLISPTKGSVNYINSPKSKVFDNAFSYVSQSPYLIDASIKENITFGSNANNQILEEIIKISNLEELISSLEDGILTPVGERGAQLSGGQKQKITIARALYMNAGFLILDEATSSLDNLSESIIMKNLLERHNRNTLIIVAHRLSTLTFCDQIYVMDDGKITDSGTWEELSKKNILFQGAK
jgi:HlyD family secretion protein